MERERRHARWNIRIEVTGLDKIRQHVHADRA
jgi:hypothetical protein